MLPAYHVAKADKALRGTPLTVYLHLLDELDPVTYRRVKQAALVKKLEISERAIRSAMLKLRARGYIERRADQKHGEAHEYRLVYNKMP